MATVSEERSLRLLAKKTAVQLADKPLSTVMALVDRGFAKVTRRYSEFHNGKTWLCEEVSITDAGRTHLQKSETKT